jgi:glycosyltransferase involved in cell wall biosynthesis
MERKIRVALMSHTMDNRAGKGSALSTRRLVERLVRDTRLDVTLIHYDIADDPLYREAREIRAPYLKLPFATRFARTMLLFWKYRKENFDIIHWFQPRLYPFFWLAPAKHIVVTAHGAGDITAPGQFPMSRRIYNFIMIHFNFAIDAIIGVSDFGREEIIEYYKVCPDRVRSILYYNGGAEEYKKLDKQLALKQIKDYGISSPYILDVSRLEPHKNVGMLVRAYILLRDSHPERKEKLVIVGAPRFKSEETLALAKNSRYSDDIQFVHFVRQEDMNALYAAAELFVFPSLNEGFGMPLIESFASGTPVVTSNVTALPEVAGDAAVLADPNDASSISEAMQRVLSDEVLRKELIKKALERARTFTWDRSAEEVTKLYEEIIKMDTR